MYAIRSYYASFKLARGLGCEACLRTGFKGRVPLQEWLAGSEEVKQLIQSKAVITSYSIHYTKLYDIEPELEVPTLATGIIGKEHGRPE